MALSPFRFIHRSMRLPVYVATLMSFHVAARAEEQTFFGSDPLLATLSNVKVIVSDEVKEGCFTNASTIKTTAELTLRQYGLHVDDGAFDTVWISALGGRNKTKSGQDLGCSAVVERNWSYIEAFSCHMQREESPLPA